MGTLHLILGRIGSGKSYELDKRIKADVDRWLAEGKNDRVRTYLIVPEHFTVTAEARIAERLSRRAPLVFEATNFTRLADVFFRSEGGLALRYADRTARTLAMWRALRELSPELPEAPEFDPASIERYLSVVREITASRIDADQLDEAVKLLSDEPQPTDGEQENGEVRLSDRLSAIARIGTRYRAILDERFADAENVLDGMAKRMKTSDFFSGTTFYFDSFTGFTEQQYAVLSELMRTSDLTVTLPLPEDPAASLCYEEPMATLKRLRAMARDAGVYCPEPLKLNKVWRTESEPLRLLTTSLFASDLTAHIDAKMKADGNVTLVEADDPYEAARYVSSDILRKVAEGGVLFRDFAVFAGDPNVYRGVLDASFDRNGIPYFFSERTDLSVLEPLKLVTGAYRAVTGFYRRVDVISVAKCGFSGLSEREKDLLELYAETWSLSGPSFNSTAQWTKDPDGLSSLSGMTDGKREYLKVVNDAKEKLMRPLRLLAASSKKQPVPDHCRAVYEFLLALDLPKQLEEHAVMAENDGDIERAELYRRFWEVALHSLDTLAEMLSDVVVTTEEYAALFDLVCHSSDVGRIPSSLDEVVVGPADLLRADGVKHAYLFGANEGEFPGTVQGSGYFSENDRDRLQKCGLELGGTKKLRASRRLFGFLRALTAPTVSVTVLTNMLATDLKTECTPSHAVKRMTQLLPEGIKKVKVSDMNPTELIRSKGEALANVGTLIGDPLFPALEKKLSETEEGKAVVRAAKAPISNLNCEISPELAAVLFPEKMKLSHSRLDVFHGCPFSYFFDKVLHLKVNQAVKVRANDVGSYFHALFEDFFTPPAGGERVSKTEEQIAGYTADFTKRHLAGIGLDLTPQTEYLFHELEGTANRLLARFQAELDHSAFEPVATELKLEFDATEKPIGDAPTALRVTIPDENGEDGGEFYIDGTVDRIDLAKIGDDVYVSIVDYKTGDDKLNLGKIEEGDSPQLLLYLFALLKNRNPAFFKRLGVSEDRIHPAAVRYVHVETEKPRIDHFPKSGEAEAKTDKAMWHSGCYLDDDAVLAALDDTPEHKFLSELSDRDKAKKSDAEGEEKNAATDEAKPEKPKVFLTEAEFATTLERIEENLRTDAKTMRSGRFRASPGSDLCKFCKMAAICRKYEGREADEGGGD